ncbi:thioredoxin family protein [Methylosinus sp. 3S-1]|nr:cytochrome C biogenesis protein [Methylosinus sp. 3S-1]
MRGALAIILGAVLLAAALPRASHAAESLAQASPYATVTLVADVDSVAPGRSFRIGLRQKLAPHWHSYWKNPGDAGVAPTLTLTLPEGAVASAIAWPGPDAIAVGPVRNFGYENEVVLPVTVTVPRTAAPGDTFSIRANAEWLVCEKKCVPESGAFRLDLPVAPTAAPVGGDVAAAFAATDARTPTPSPWIIEIAEEGADLVLAASGDGLSADRIKSAFFYPVEGGVIDHAAPQRLEIAEGRLRLAIEKAPDFDARASRAGVLAIVDGEGRTRWLETEPAPVAAASTPAPSDSLPLWQAALFAFLGGMILNLMPCVFPVLAIKAASLARLSGGDLREARLSGAFYTFGVLVAFVSLAGVLLAMRAAGGAVGWGFQFQSPTFVAAMSWLLLAIALNLSGVYEIGLGVVGAGQGLAEKPGHVGSFFTGVLAVTVATPCTAPFMGAAIGVALTLPAPLCLALFAAMGLGLAAPFALLAVAPRLARLLPRPGVWMLRLRQAMAFPMYASAAWLVWVLGRQAGDAGVAIGLAGGLLVGFGAWTYGIAQQGAGRGLFSRGLAAAAAVGLVALLPQLGGAQAPHAEAATAAGAEPFTNARLAALRREGRPVFVNLTAAWCITCLVNERMALSTAAVKEAFATRGVAYLKGDWTSHDPEITAFLRSFERDGVPFYAYYPAGAREPVVLPAVLTEAAVVSEVEGSVLN